MAPPKVVSCPRCGIPVECVPGNRNWPFCSERCRMIDLGTWANDGYRVPVDENDNDGELPETPGDNR